MYVRTWNNNLTYCQHVRIVTLSFFAFVFVLCTFVISIGAGEGSMWGNSDLKKNQHENLSVKLPGVCSRSKVKVRVGTLKVGQSGGAAGTAKEYVLAN